MKKNSIVITIALLHFILGTAVCQAQTFEEVLGYGLPVVVVNTSDGEEPTSEVIQHSIGGQVVSATITNAVQKEARMQIYRGDTLWYDSGDYVEDKSGIKIRHRGNTSAIAFDNKPFKLKLQKKADLIDTHVEGDITDRRSKDWVLLTYVYSIELPVAYKLASLVGMEYTPRLQFVNVIINGDYRGMYVLMESISREKDCRIIADKTDGYIIELDPYFWNEPLSIKYKFTGFLQWTLKYPKPEDLTAEQEENIRNDISQFETAVTSNNYPEVIDVHSFALWILVHDIMGTRDASGCNLYITRADRMSTSLMRMPVVWDMASSSMEVPNEWSRSHTETALFFYRLFTNEKNLEFTKAYMEEWKRIKEAHIFDSLIAFIDGYTSTPEGKGIKRSATHHMQRWNYSYGLDVIEAHAFLAKRWMNNRYQWLEENISAMMPNIVMTGDNRPQVGDSLSISCGNYNSKLTFKWIRGNASGVFDDSDILTDTSYYIITEKDLEHWLRVTVCDKAGKILYTKDTWISKLPVLYIDTEDGKPITSKENYLTAHLRIQGNTDFEQQYLGTTEIRGRGTTSWSQYPQKPYKLKLDKKTNLFGFGKSKHWVLVPNFNDKSCMRNLIASELARQLGAMGMNMTWVDVVLNGEVKGCYMLSQHIRVDRNSVDIFDWEGEAEDVADNLFLAVKENDTLEEADKKLLEDTMTSNLAWVTDGCITFKGKTYNLADFGLKKEYNISQGYLLEATAKKDGLTQFTTPGNVHFEVHTPEFLYTNNGMLAYVTELWKEYEAEYSRVPTLESIKNFSKYADMESMVAVWLVNEIMGQGDPTNSRYSYIAGDGKLHFGPVWDFDHAAASWSTSRNTKIFYTLLHNLPYIYFRKWFPDPELCQMTYETYWNVARPFIMDYIAEGGELDAKYAHIAEAGRTNDLLWGSYPSEMKPNAEPRTTAEDVEILRTFLLGHINWLDSQFSSVRTLIEAMNLRCTYPCDPDLIDGIASPNPSPQGKGFNKIIKNKHLYIIRDGETYSIDGKRIK